MQSNKKTAQKNVQFDQMHILMLFFFLRGGDSVEK